MFTKIGEERKIGENYEIEISEEVYQQMLNSDLFECVDGVWQLKSN